MNTYIKNDNNEFFAVRASHKLVKTLPRVVSGEFMIVPATKTLRESARLNINVKVLRVVGDNLMYL